eukprot:gnl/TRDRNA2_/TRDRNA2_147774_c0_seq1.p1 gnl/TRDRNA2_/TRDRNA2_147774_c0~~gnl/TRDRNA2_/TRDRNA2_147774_c0_seq1.p1  ORF type:complete len:358 (-),score=61.76 gnl/TRDRNA2_/TRDRNA2_147774_c0_seq1:103-1134(-)
MWCEAEIDHYREVLEACRKAGLSSVVTLHHFSSPVWFSARGGWKRKQNATAFATYCGYIIRRLGHLMDYICTVNEPNLLCTNQTFQVVDAFLNIEQFNRWRSEMAEKMGCKPDEMGMFPVGCFDCAAEAAEVFAEAHRQGIRAIRAADPTGRLRIGLTVACTFGLFALPGGEAEVARLHAETREDLMLDLARESSCDFVGIQQYSSATVGPHGRVKKPADGADIADADGLEIAVRYAAQRSGLPVLITESGLASNDDSRRGEFIYRAVEGVHRCIQNGIRVLGYIYWSFLDSWEFNKGFECIMGLVAVKRPPQGSFERLVKPSAFVLGRLARSNGAILNHAKL